MPGDDECLAACTGGRVFLMQMPLFARAMPNAFTTTIAHRDAPGNDRTCTGPQSAASSGGALARAVPIHGGARVT